MMKKKYYSKRFFMPILIMAMVIASIMLVQLASAQTVGETTLELRKRIDYAWELLKNTHVSETGTDIPIDEYWATQEAHTELENAINAAQLVLDSTVDFITTPMIAAGSSHVLALGSNGTICSWGGGNASGQLGNGTTTSSHTPVQVLGLNNVTAVATGSSHSIAIKNDGTIWTWGNNSNGQLGNGTTESRHTPEQVLSLNGVNIVAIAARDRHTIALCEDGYVWAWGRNFFGQLGNGSTEDSHIPVKVQTLDNITAIAAGENHNVALRDDNTVWFWGNSTQGAFHTPRQVRYANTQIFGNVKSISAGQDFTVVIRDDDTVWAWGNNNSGRLGDNSQTNRNTPVRVVHQNLDFATTISAGRDHVVAIRRSNGIGFGWGNNLFGQLGNNVQHDIQRLVPTQMVNRNNMVIFSAGTSFTVSMRNDGMVFSWGSNLFGMLGDGTTNNSHLPVRVRGLNGEGFLNLYDLPPLPAARYWTATVYGNGTLAEGSTSGNVAVGSSITLSLDERTDYRLTSLTVSGTDITPGVVNLTARTIQFTMPSGTGSLSVTVTPTWVYDPPLGPIPGISYSDTINSAAYVRDFELTIDYAQTPNPSLAFFRTNGFSGLRLEIIPPTGTTQSLLLVRPANANTPPLRAFHTFSRPAGEAMILTYTLRVSVIDNLPANYAGITNFKINTGIDGIELLLNGSENAVPIELHRSIHFGAGGNMIVENFIPHRNRGVYYRFSTTNSNAVITIAQSIPFATETLRFRIYDINENILYDSATDANSRRTTHLGGYQQIDKVRMADVPNQPILPPGTYFLEIYNTANGTSFLSGQQMVVVIGDPMYNSDTITAEYSQQVTALANQWTAVPIRVNAPETSLVRTISLSGDYASSDFALQGGNIRFTRETDSRLSTTTLSPFSVTPPLTSVTQAQRASGDWELEYRPARVLTMTPGIRIDYIVELGNRWNTRQ